MGGQRLSRIDKLRRLRGEERSTGETGAPEKAGLADLRKRLDRILGEGKVVPGAQTPAPRSRESLLDQYVTGNRTKTASGETFVAEELIPPGNLHGQIPVEKFGELPSGPLTGLFPTALEAVSDASGFLYLDTETTGLAGGAGTIPFMVGVGRWTEGGFKVVQFFLENLDREAALLEALSAELSGAQCVVTYNGNAYDIPLLENRYVMNRTPWPLENTPQLDLLYPCRALWKGKYENCRLVTLEEQVLGYRRTGDIPGAEIPPLYNRFLRRQADPRLKAVFTHNVLDIITLAGLLWVIGEGADGRWAGIEAGMGKLLSKSMKHAEAGVALRAALETSMDPETRSQTLRRLISAQKRTGQWEALLETATEMIEHAPVGDPFPYTEAAKALEHKLKDFPGALAVLDRALALGPWHPDDLEDMEKRRSRLLKKINR